MSAQELTSQERAYLRSLANGLESIFQFGKGGVSENYIKQLDDALEARELIKISLLENADASPKELAAELCVKARCQSVQIIGRKIVLYRQSHDKDKRKITLPQ